MPIARPFKSQRPRCDHPRVPGVSCNKQVRVSHDGNSMATESARGRMIVITTGHVLSDCIETMNIVTGAAEADTKVGKADLPTPPTISLHKLFTSAQKKIPKVYQIRIQSDLRTIPGQTQNDSKNDLRTIPKSPQEQPKPSENHPEAIPGHPRIHTAIPIPFQ